MTARPRDRVAWLLCLLAALPTASAWGESRVDARAGRITATFEDTAAPEALAAIRQATGVEIVLPASAQAKTLTLAVEDLPFERFLQRLLDALDLGGYMLVFAPGAAAPRVIVVDRAGPVPAAPPPTGPPKAPPGGTPGVASEPVYVPPATPPVYIPPATPPVYVPPATPPVYIPPATPPVYVPPVYPPVHRPGVKPPTGAPGQ